MDDIITKVDAVTLEIKSTDVTVEKISLDDLHYQRNSLVKTKENNTQEAIAKNLEIDALIVDIDAKIAKAKTLGVLTTKEAIDAGVIFS